MNFNKLILLSLVSLFSCSSIFSMDNNQMSQSVQKYFEQLKDKNTQLSLLAGAASGLATYKVLPETLFAKYAEAFMLCPESQEYSKAALCLSLLGKTFYSKPMVPGNLVPKAHQVYVALKMLASVYAGYLAFNKMQKYLVEKDSQPKLDKELALERNKEESARKEYLEAAEKRVKERKEAQVQAEAQAQAALQARIQALAELEARMEALEGQEGLEEAGQEFLAQAAAEHLAQAAIAAQAAEAKRLSKLEAEAQFQELIRLKNEMQAQERVVIATQAAEKANQRLNRLAQAEQAKRLEVEQANRIASWNQQAGQFQGL
ncbi:MAG: hypothetical protein P4L22_03290 [Candidatus Babeliales bacterium]|nr:hypothetical protein [Candidatus Babeliales bacterium]